jgi:hypothetical protein
MFEVSHLPVAVDEFIPQARQQAPESLRHTGDDSVFSGPGFEGFADGVKTETGIGPHANLADVGRNIRKASVPQLDAAVPSSCVTSAQFGIPEVGGVGFDAQEQIMRTLATVARVVADVGAVLLSKHGDHGAVEIEDKARPMHVSLKNSCS